MLQHAGLDWFETGVSVAGAAGWGVVALARGERISAVWLLVAALCSYAIGYRFYSKFIARRVLRADDVADLVDELRVLRQFPRVLPVRLQPGRPPDPGDRGLRQADLGGQ